MNFGLDCTTVGARQGLILKDLTLLSLGGQISDLSAVTCSMKSFTSVMVG